MLLAMRLPNILKDERVQMILTGWKGTPGRTVRGAARSTHSGNPFLRVRRAPVRAVRKNGAKVRSS